MNIITKIKHYHNIAQKYYRWELESWYWKHNESIRFSVS